MAVRYRPMRPNDAKECVEIVAAHPFMGPRYGSGTTDLRTVWLSLLGREAFRAVVFEDGEDTQVRIMGVGVSAFVSHDFLLELKTHPFSGQALRWLNAFSAAIPRCFRTSRYDTPTLTAAG